MEEVSDMQRALHGACAGRNDLFLRLATAVSLADERPRTVRQEQGNLEPNVVSEHVPLSLDKGVWCLRRIDNYTNNLSNKLIFN